MAFFGLTALAGIDRDGFFRANVRSILNVRTKEDWIEIYQIFCVYADKEGTFHLSELKNLLTTFYNREPPEREVDAIGQQLAQNESGLVSWQDLVDAIQAATAAEDAGAVDPLTEYRSSQEFHDDLVRHTRRKAGPQQQYKQPMLSSQEIGWLEGLTQPVGGARFGHRTAALSHLPKQN